MNLENIKSIELSLLIREGDNVINGQAPYRKCVTAKFKIPEESFIESEEFLNELLESMYQDIKKQAPEEADSIGIWIDNGSYILENSLYLRTLEDIRMYSSQNLNPLLEFFKMTFENNG